MGATLEKDLTKVLDIAYFRAVSSTGESCIVTKENMASVLAGLMLGGKSNLHRQYLYNPVFFSRLQVPAGHWLILRTIPGCDSPAIGFQEVNMQVHHITTDGFGFRRPYRYKMGRLLESTKTLPVHSSAPTQEVCSIYLIRGGVFFVISIII